MEAKPEAASRRRRPKGAGGDKAEGKAQRRRLSPAGPTRRARGEGPPRRLDEMVLVAPMGMRTQRERKAPLEREEAHLTLVLAHARPFGSIASPTGLGAHPPSRSDSFANASALRVGRLHSLKGFQKPKRN